MYYGKRREMLSYFAFIEYPCPAYKNPSDYYRKYFVVKMLICNYRLLCVTNTININVT